MRADDLKSVEAALARAEIYSEFSDAARARLGAAGVLVNLAPEALLFSKGDPGDSLFVLLEGEVEVRTSTEAGKDVRLASLKPPALIGEMAVLDGGARSADIAAIRRSRLVRISRDAAIDALTSEPKALLKLVAVLSRRLRRANEELEDAAVLDLGGRLAQRLLEEAGDGAVVTLTQTELARRIGASREKVNRKLHEWCDEGWITLGRSGIKLTKRDQLQALIREARSG
ncbi:MAG TPA: Crp/Fnr family transcriptional regulator [Caulobacterales bacterium]|nr:Crp/Fnr family transcriptional regulator [Caulobacterales bacterium]